MNSNPEISANAHHLPSVFYDKVRVIAIFLVVLLHVSSQSVYQFGQIAPANWMAANVIDSFTRCCVPLFLMLSGGLILGKDYPSYRQFYKNRVFKIFMPLVFWSIFYYVLNGYLNEQPIGVQDFITIFTKGPSTYHLWYLYLIIGIYSCAPFLRKMLVNFTAKDVNLFLLIWFVFILLLPNILLMLNHFKIPNYGIYLPNTLFTGYFGYFILGYVLVKFDFPKMTLRRSLAGFIVTSLLIAILTYWYSIHFKQLSLFFYENISPLVAIQSACLFLYLKSINLKKQSKSPKIWSKLSSISFGVFLVHVGIIDVLRSELLPFQLNTGFADSIISIPCLFLIVSALSVLICLGIQAIPYVRKII